jgi:Ala-tRNA(Pro) deacylase
MKEDSAPVSRVLAKMKIPHRLYRHSGPIQSLEQAARERGQDPTQIVRSILFRLSANEFVMVLIAGTYQIDWRALRRYLEQSRLTTASEEEVVLVTGYQLGAVSPFGLPAPMRVLVDQSVLLPEEISIGSGIRGTTVIMRSADMIRALGDVETIDVGKIANK